MNAGNAAKPPQTGAYCEEAKRLLEAFGEAVHALIELHQLQFQAVVDGDADASRFDLLIHEAVEKKQNAKYAYLGHLDTHGCSKISG